MISWAYFKENIGHFDIHAPTLRKIKRKWEKFSFEKKKKIISKIFFEIFWQIFFHFKFLFELKFITKEIFSEKFQKKFDPKKIRNFFQMIFFVIFFAKLGHGYQNALNFLEKKPMRSQKLIGFLCFLELSKSTLQYWPPCSWFTVI